MSGKKGGNKLKTYKLFKNSLAFEPYLKIAHPEKRRIIAQFRTSAHRLHIETGRFVITIPMFHLTRGYANVALWAKPKMNSTF